MSLPSDIRSQKQNIMPATCATSGEIKIFLHHIYELQEGVRNMALCTLNAADTEFAIKRLQRLNISFFKQELGNHNINLFFGKEECIQTVQLIINRPLNCLTPEEDFIIGALLGYGISQQCKRYTARKTAVLKTA